MSDSQGLQWYGDKVRARMEKAARLGVNQTMTQCVVMSKHVHPFQNRTGTAERSIRVAVPARTLPSGETVGFWGSVGVRYFKHLELGLGLRFATLVPVARAIYPKLTENIRRAWRAA